jgi:hypothetical protein
MDDPCVLLLVHRRHNRGSLDPTRSDHPDSQTIQALRRITTTDLLTATILMCHHEAAEDGRLYLHHKHHSYKPVSAARQLPSISAMHQLSLLTNILRVLMYEQTGH